MSPGESNPYDTENSELREAWAEGDRAGRKGAPATGRGPLRHEEKGKRLAGRTHNRAGKRVTAKTDSLKVGRTHPL